MSRTRILSRIALITVVFLFAFQGTAAAQDADAAKLANEHFQAKDWAKAAPAYQALAKANPSNGQAWFRLGYALHEMGQYQEALNAYEQARAAGWTPAAVAYRSARAYAKMGNADKATEMLSQLAQGGFQSAALLEGDADLQSLRADARFAAAILQIKKNARPCDHDPNYRMFDFWVGDWNVTVGGSPAGTNRIELIENNCVVFENWAGAGGGTGRSFNFYNNQTKKWNQIWVDSSGNNLQFEGEFRDGALYYKATTVGANGAKTLHELTFFNLEPGHVRQLWKSSTDGGATWTTVFDGDYRRK